MSSREYLEEFAKIASQVVAVVGLFALLVRFVCLPLRKVFVTLRKNSELILHGLPVLEGFLQRWSATSGTDSFLNHFDALEAKCLANEAFIDSIVRLKKEPAYICDPSGECILASDSLCELFGLEHEDMLGRGWLAALANEDRDKVWDKWYASIAKRIPYDAEYPVRNQRNHSRWRVTTIAYPVLDKTKKLICFYGELTEIKPE